MLVTESPRILELNRDNQFMSRDVMDFWRPVYAEEALVDGKYSAEVYREFFRDLWSRYKEKTGRSINRLLGLNEYARTIEMKQACYAGTYGLMQARDYVALHPGSKVLVMASDIARYGLHTPGEVTQGAGAVAEEPDKYLIGIGETEQAVVPPTQDVVTMAANAADQLLTAEERAEIDTIIFATESGIDNSKSAAVYVQVTLLQRNAAPEKLPLQSKLALARDIMNRIASQVEGK
ncbi:hypothetical protein H7R52_11985 [Weissella confusa]|uniref:Uncharacterized protein n=1 Tax=Weissella confusa TaxID=1583 RepID=A0A923NKB6_WEICO|nr:hypothetical protein [Weissella confusa]